MNTNNRFKTRTSIALVSAILLTAARASWAGLPPLTTVGDAGNASDPATGYGAVSNVFQIGVNEVTRSEYAEFLNAVAATDTHGLYNANMGIARTGSAGSYHYTATNGTRSVAWVSWYDALRYVNWLHNGQPTGALAAAQTETGAYTFTDTTNVSSRNSQARVFLPNENEWYKAAYYQGGANAFYWAYPTRSDTPPQSVPPGNGDNMANYDLAVNDVTPAGSYPVTGSYYGTRDQAGNLWEWNETAVDGDRGLRGGSYDDYPALLLSAHRDSQEPGLGCEFVGFRIAAAANFSPPSHTNQAPKTVADSYTVISEAALTVGAPGVLANDTDADGDPLSAMLISAPTHGALKLSANGAFTYTSVTNYSGTDSFTYSANDGTVNGNSATVSITVQPILYTVTVNGGNGDGAYAYGASVAIQADPAPAGMVFDRWTGDTATVVSATSPVTSLIVKRSALTVTTAYKADAKNSTFAATSAAWNSTTRALLISGFGPVGKVVTVYGPSNAIIGKTIIRAKGKWQIWSFRSAANKVPNKVRVVCGGLTQEISVSIVSAGG